MFLHKINKCDLFKLHNFMSNKIRPLRLLLLHKMLHRDVTELIK